MAAMTWWSTLPFCVVLVGVAGVAGWWVVPERFSTARQVGQIGLFLAMSAMLFHGHFVPYEPPRGDLTTARTILVGSAKILWWIHLAWALIGFVRIFLVFEGRPREARLLQDLVVAIVYIGMLLSILAFVFAMPIGTLIATSGVFAIILGLALQNTVSDVFSGIALNLGRPYTLGDWIILSDGTEGRVVETNWRSTHLLTLTHNVVALPNSFLAKLGVTNVSRPDESHGLSLTIRLVPTKMPAAILDLMHTVLMSCNSIVKDPPPSVAAKGLDASALEVALYFRVSNVNMRSTARNEIYDLVYRHAKSTGLLLAMPLSAPLVMGTSLGQQTAVAMNFTAIELIREVPIFAALTDSEKESLAATSSIRNYRKGEVIARCGESLPSLMIVQSGTIIRQRVDDEGRDEDIGYLAPGDFFGETGLLAGVGEVSTLRAMTHVVVYEIDQQSFGPLLLERPEMAEGLAAILATRIPISSEATGQSHLGSRHALLDAVRAMFHAGPPSAR